MFIEIAYIGENECYETRQVITEITKATIIPRIKEKCAINGELYTIQDVIYDTDNNKIVILVS